MHGWTRRSGAHHGRTGFGPFVAAVVALALIGSARWSVALDASGLRAHAEGRRLALAGDIAAAQREWDAVLRRSEGPVYSIRLAAACTEDELRLTLEATRAMAPIWISGAGPCREVHWGAFASEAEARTQQGLLSGTAAWSGATIGALRPPLAATGEATRAARQPPRGALVAPDERPAETPAAVQPPAASLGEAPTTEAVVTPREPERPHVEREPVEAARRPSDEGDRAPERTTVAPPPERAPPAPAPPPEPGRAPSDSERPASPRPAEPAEPAPPATAASLFSEGNDAYARGDFDDAVGKFEASIALEPTNPRTYNNLGTAWLRKGDAEQAERAFREALELEPTYARAALNLSTALYSRGRYDEAERELRHVMELEPGNVDAYRNLGALQIEMRRWQDAMATLEEGLRISPGNESLEQLLGQVRLQVAARQEPVEDQPAAPSAAAPTPQPRRAEGGDASSSPCRDDLSRAGRVHLAGKYFGEARQSRERGDLVRARDGFEAALECDPTSAPTANHLGAVRLELGDASGALDAFDLALTLDPSSVDAGVNRALALVELGRCPEAGEQVERVLSARSEDGDLLLLRGQVLLRCGRVTEATDALEVAVERHPADDRPRRLLERIHSEQVSVP